MESRKNRLVEGGGFRREFYDPKLMHRSALFRAFAFGSRNLYRVLLYFLGGVHSSALDRSFRFYKCEQRIFAWDWRVG